MCGIAGVYHSDRQAAPSEQGLKAMCDAILHRGPDEAGYFVQPGIALGHRRLSIIDVSHGQQPMVTPDERYSLVFNGEIYNYRDIRDELIALGAQFQTASDTEVILQGWKQWGIDVVDKLAGMFAFAIWDKQDHSCHLVRDRLGIKPLFYCLDQGSCFFGSELKAITAIKGAEFDLNYQAIEDYFTFGYVPEPKTIYRGVNKLEPGHYLKLTPDGLEKVKYWDVNLNTTHQYSPELDRQFEGQLNQAVTSHLESEVPLGAFLSGGVDSSAVVATMANQGVSPINSCSIGFDVPEYDETQWATAVAERYKTDHNRKTVSADDYELLDKLVWLYDEPYADSSALPTYRVCELAREKVTVCLSGDGADELLGGYRRYKLHLMEETLRQKLPLSIRKPIFGTLGKVYPKMDWAPQFLRAKTTLLSLSWDAAEAYYNSVSFLPSWLRAKLFSPDFVKELDGYSSLNVFREHEANYMASLQGAENHPDKDPLSLIQYLDMKTYLVGDILTKVDRASMAHSLEVRVPFLDHRFVDWCGGLPHEAKMNQGVGKAILKRIMEPHLPHDILYRSKMGFRVPLDKWFKGPLKERVNDQLTSQSFKDLGIFNNDFIAKSLKQNASGTGNHSTMIWTLLMFSLFIEKKGQLS